MAGGNAAIKVSVIIPVRNAEAQVSVTMDSLFAQTRLPDEIVVADGDSTDDTVARVREYSDRGVPVRIVRNVSRFAGGGRNAATRAASFDLIAALDMGNRAAPGWLEEMVQPFIEDPELDYLGGVFYPMLDSSFARVSGAVSYFRDCLGLTWDINKLREHVPADPLPGGMSLAFRRTIFELAGGWSEWAKKSQDRLFSHRVRNVGGKISMSLTAVMYHHMSHSFGELWDRDFHYGIWGARTALPRRRFRKLALVYSIGLALLLFSLVQPLLLAPLAGLVIAYLYVAAWRKLAVLTEATGDSFSLSQWVQAPLVLFVRDAAVLLGNFCGDLDRLVRPKWRRLTRDYLELGQQP